MARPLAVLLQRLTSITFDFLHICMSVYYCTITSVDSVHQYQIWMASACQGFGAQRDVASCRKRESRGKSKTGHLQICQGSSPTPSFCPQGKTHQRKRSLPPFIPPFLPSPCSALPGMCSPFYYSSVPPCDTESNGNRCHLAWSQFLTATCFPQTFIL